VRILFIKIPFQFSSINIFAILYLILFFCKRFIKVSCHKSQFKKNLNKQKLANLIEIKNKLRLKNSKANQLEKIRSINNNKVSRHK